MLELLPILLLVLGLVARLGRRQSILAALHPVNGLLITLLAIVLARTAWVERNAGVPEASSAD